MKCPEEIRKEETQIKKIAMDFLNKKINEPSEMSEKIQKASRINVILDEMEYTIQDEELSDEEALKKLVRIKKEIKDFLT